MKQEVIHEVFEKMKSFYAGIDDLKAEIQTVSPLHASAMSILSILGDETMTQKEITEIAGLNKSTISRQMKQMEDEDLVVRATGDDKRYAYYTATDKGKQALMAKQFELYKRLNEILTSWPVEELQLFNILLGRFNRSVRQSIDEAED